MASHSNNKNINQSSTIDNTIMDNTMQSTLVRPTTISPSTPNRQTNQYYYNIENICLSPSSSPLDTRLHLFKPGTLFDRQTFERIQSSVPKTYEEEHEAEFWSKRAIIYRMGPDEYFHRKPSHVAAAGNDDDNQISSNSTVLSENEHIDDTTI